MLAADCKGWDVQHWLMSDEIGKIQHRVQRGGFEMPCVEGLLMVMHQALAPARMATTKCVDASQPCWPSSCGNASAQKPKAQIPGSLLTFYMMDIHEQIIRCPMAELVTASDCYNMFNNRKVVSSILTGADFLHFSPMKITAEQKSIARRTNFLYGPCASWWQLKIHEKI